jgi:hypothetical protein
LPSPHSESSLQHQYKPFAGRKQRDRAAFDERADQIRAINQFDFGARASPLSPISST